MAHVSDKLHRLRNWFVAYYVFTTFIGTVIALIVVHDVTDTMVNAPRARLVGTPFIVGIALASSALALALGLLVFWKLEQLRNWSRIGLLVFGWLGAVSGPINIISSFGLMGMQSYINRLVPGLDMGPIVVLGLMSNIAGTAYWIYLIRVLQFDPEVTAAFSPREDTI